MSGYHTKGSITIQGARTHNLQNLDISIPHHQLIVITGRSGSGKSSLAFDTIFAEGQLIYLESLNAYVRQFLRKVERPPLDSIQGLLPSIGMQQKTKNSNPRARVATSSDLYSYLKILYARMGTTYSPISGEPVKKHSVQDVVDYILAQKAGSKIFILSPLQPPEKETWQESLATELGKGFTRLLWKDKTIFIEQALQEAPPEATDKIYLLIDRIIVKPDDDQLMNRLADSVQTAFHESEGRCIIKNLDGATTSFSDRMEADGMTFEVPTMSFFSFNNSYGACSTCRGWGKYADIDPQKVIPNPELTLRKGAIRPWRGIVHGHWQRKLLAYAQEHDLPIDTPYEELSPAQQDLLWQGDASKGWQGINDFFHYINQHIYKVAYRMVQARYRNFIDCKKCRGTGLRPDIDYVKIGGKSLTDLLNMRISQIATFFSKFTLLPHQQKIGAVLLESIRKKLDYLQRVGLGYLFLKRRTNTLSGGELQRLRLGKLLGTPLVDALYVLDEPTIGLHPRDTANLIDALSDLQKIGNTVIVVEHEEALMRAAHHIIDIGPASGKKGGQVVFQGNWKALVEAKESETANYLTGKTTIPLPKERKKASHSLTLSGIRIHNLKNLTATFPLGIFTAVTGVSGSGKSTLTEQVLYPALCQKFGITHPAKRHYQTLSGDLDQVEWVEYFSQGSMGKSSRSNIATYLKVYDAIGKWYAKQPLAVERGYTSQFFSLNVGRGRCEPCMGDGEMVIDMQFMSDVAVPCEACQGKRFKPSILEITYKGKNIAEVLEMSVDESLQFFHDKVGITNKLEAVQKVGLGYLPIGQASSHFSSGEAQRVRLSLHLVKKQVDVPTVFIFDEPTTGLHFHDIAQLLLALRELVARGHSVIVIEHNTDVMKCADWIIDLGPEAGEGGGEIVFAGSPEELIKSPHSHTARYLKGKLHR